jgi:hypothetical protein
MHAALVWQTHRPQSNPDILSDAPRAAWPLTGGDADMPSMIPIEGRHGSKRVKLTLQSVIPSRGLGVTDLVQPGWRGEHRAW